MKNWNQGVKVLSLAVGVLVSGLFTTQAVMAQAGAAVRGEIVRSPVERSIERIRTEAERGNRDATRLMERINNQEFRMKTPEAQIQFLQKEVARVFARSPELKAAIEADLAAKPTQITEQGKASETTSARDANAVKACGMTDGDASAANYFVDSAEGVLATIGGEKASDVEFAATETGMSLDEVSSLQMEAVKGNVDAQAKLGQIESDYIATVSPELAAEFAVLQQMGLVTGETQVELNKMLGVAGARANKGALLLYQEASRLAKANPGISSIELASKLQTWMGQKLGTSAEEVKNGFCANCKNVAPMACAA